MLAKIAYYEKIRYPAPTSPAVAPEEDEETTVDIPEDIDESLLFPDISLHVPERHSLHPIPADSSFKRYSIACTPQGNIIPTTSPQLLSHLLQPTTTGTVTPVLPSEQMSNPNERFLLPSNMKNSPTRMYRVRLPAGTDSVVRLPNSLVIRRLHDRRIVVCSTAMLPPGQSSPNVRFGTSQSNTQAASKVANKVSSAPKECQIKIESSYSLKNDNKRTAEISSVASNSKNYSRITDVTGDKNLDLDPASLTMIVKSTKCLDLIFKRLSVKSLLR